MLLDINLYIFIYTAHTETGTVGQRMTGAVMRETETLYSALTKGEGLEMDAVTGEDLLAPSHCSPSDLFLPSKPQRCTYAWGRHTLKFAWACVRGLVKQQNRAETLNRQTCMWGCQGYSVLAHLCFFSLKSSFLLFFITVVFSFFSILVLSTKIILNVVLSLSLPLFFPLT